MDHGCRLLVKIGFLVLDLVMGPCFSGIAQKCQL
jgi:hypothetical protein